MVTPLDRAQFPITSRGAYLNTARQGPIPRDGVIAVRDVTDQAMRLASDGWAAWDGRHAILRDKGAQLLGAHSAADVGLISNTTQMFAAVAHGLRLRAGSRVVARASAFPTTRLVWESLAEEGVVVDLIDDGTSWAEALTRPADVVAAAWVRTDTGERVDLARLASMSHDAGAVLVVDAIQGVGVVPAQMAEWGVDAAGAAGFKWLLAPEGTGLAYLSPDLRARLRLAQPGWFSDWQGQPGPDGIRPALAFLEGGSPNSIGLAALDASVDMLLDADVAVVWDHVETLRDRLAAGVVALGGQVVSPDAPGQKSGIVTCRLPDADRLNANLLTQGVVVSPRGDGLRASVHGFNTAEDVDLLLDLLATAAA